MNTTIKIIAIIFLLFLGFGGLFGGWILISDPTGGKFGWSPDLLAATPFSSYLLPGIALFLCNGLFPLLAVVMLLLRHPIAPWLSIAQGAITIIWLTAEIFFNPEFFVPGLHYPFYGVGLVLISCGIVLLRAQRNALWNRPIRPSV